ncbi:MAG: citrate synthase [Eubacteriales bacterium]
MNRYQNLCDLCTGISELYQIDSQYYQGDPVKRGLRNADGTGVVAGVTRIANVEGYVMQDGRRVAIPGKLIYRGIDVENIVSAHAQQKTFGYEEVAYLLLFGKLPTRDQLSLFNDVLSRARQMPEHFTEDMIMRAPGMDIMNKLARCVLALYAYDERANDTSLENMVRQSIELIARFPIIVANAYATKRHYSAGESLHIHFSKEGLSVSENFLRVLRPNKQYLPEEAHILDLMMILHAEHGGGNNSAFVCRAVSSTGTDTYSAIGAAVGSLKGPLHGGANAKVMEMFRDAKSAIANPRDGGQIRDYLCRVLRREAGDRSGLIYGLGHAVYTVSDPRAVMLKQFARELAGQKDRVEDFELLAQIEENAVDIVNNTKNRGVAICANVDMYSGLVYDMLGIPEDLFTPLFAVSRIAGWCAHRIEEVACHKIMRPAYNTASQHQVYIPLEERA